MSYYGNENVKFIAKLRVIYGNELKNRFKAEDIRHESRNSSKSVTPSDKHLINFSSAAISIKSTPHFVIIRLRFAAAADHFTLRENLSHKTSTKIISEAKTAKFIINNNFSAVLPRPEWVWNVDLLIITIFLQHYRHKFHFK